MSNIYSKRSSKVDVNAEIAKLSIMSRYLAADVTISDSGVFTPDENELTLTQHFNYEGSSPITSNGGDFILPGGFMYECFISAGFLTTADRMEVAFYPGGSTVFADLIKGSQAGLFTGDASSGRSTNSHFFINRLEESSSLRYFLACSYSDIAGGILNGSDFTAGAEHPTTVEIRQLFSA